jgi:hypothetical protein
MNLLPTTNHSMLKFLRKAAAYFAKESLKGTRS